jgi:hypothetical protein
MTIMRSIRWATAVALATTTLAHSGPLTVVEVAAPTVNCVFRTNCIIPVTDSSSQIPLPFTAGQPFLQSRTFTGTVGAPANGLIGYEYRVDMRSAAGAAECLLGLVVDFGPVVKLPYKSGSNADVYVVTRGGLGTISVKSAEQDGSVITFNFSKPMCVGTNAGQGESTFFFGLASAKQPHEIDAGMYGFGTPAFISLKARAPNH